MLENKLYVNLDKQDFSSLHIIVALSDDTKITEMLIGNGANINQCCNDMTLLQMACGRENKSQFLCLIAHGADLILPNGNAFDPLKRISILKKPLH